MASITNEGKWGSVEMQT